MPPTVTASRSRTAVPALALFLLAACGGAKEQPAPSDSAGASGAASTSAAPAADAGGEQTPDAGGKVITVQMETDDQGNNKFSPAEVEAKRGDVIRYTLKNGVHNVHFLADSNPGKTGLPAAGPLLQLPGQTYDVKVAFAPGKYYFQCDPHALLGMRGRLEVEEH